MLVLIDAIGVMTGIWTVAKTPVLVELEVQAFVQEAVLNSPLLGKAA